MTDGHAWRSMAREMGIIGFFQRERERTSLWQVSAKSSVPLTLAVRKRALGSGQLRKSRALATSHNNNNLSRRFRALELNLKFKQNGDKHCGKE